MVEYILIGLWVAAIVLIVGYYVGMALWSMHDLNKSTKGYRDHYNTRKKKK